MTLKSSKFVKMISVLSILSVLLVACAPDIPPNAANPTTENQNQDSNQGEDTASNSGNTNSADPSGTNTDDKAGNAGEDSSKGGDTPISNEDKDNNSTSNPTDDNDDTVSTGNKGTDVDKTAAADPYSMAVLVNQEFGLPEDYNPTDLVYPDVPFLFKEKIEKRKMRSEAAKALEKLFAGAKKDGIYLAGVSAYRSNATQKALFDRYVKKDGLEKAKTYSAEPGHSEHATGLAIDVSGSTGKFAAESGFADTEEAKWLDKHATEYGFIIRYPEGKQSITGYKYEPWHLRYVGKEIASDIAERGITLEEYYNAVPVSAK